MIKNLAFVMALPLLACLPLPRAGAVDSVQIVPDKAFPKAQQPQAAVDATGGIHVAFGSENSIYTTTSRDGGKTFAKPVLVGSFGKMALGMRRGPRIVATGKTLVITAIGGKVGRGTDEDLVAWRSTDGGATWVGPVRINSVQASAREGLHQTAAGPDGTIFCTWLDLREKKTVVYGASSRDGGASWDNEKAIYSAPVGNVCECCSPQVTYDPKNVLHVMWRNQIDGNRDMYLFSSTDHGKTFGPASKLGQGTWPLKGCPMDGGALAASGDGKVLTIWMRMKEIFTCVPGEAEVSHGKGTQGWAVNGPGGFYVAWVVTRPGPLMVLTPGAKKPVEIVASGWDPVLAAPVTGTGPVVLVWEDGKTGANRIHAAVLSPASK